MPELTREIAYTSLQDFFQNKPFVLFGTGTSCAVDSRFGMDALKEHLVEEMSKQALNTEQQLEWSKVVTKLASTDLETAMNVVSDSNLIKLIVKLTGDFVAKLDQHHSASILNGSKQWPALAIVEKIFMGLSPTDRKLHIATPNYDLLAEYAFERANLEYTTGFVGGICRRLDWQRAGFRMKTEERLLSNKGKVGLKDQNHIRLYKVHGSLNTFKVENTIVENNAWTYDVPDVVKRIMITPGVSKYEKLHEYRPMLLTQFDKAVAEHNAFLFLGFGFNDNQLNKADIEGKLINQECQGIIITRDSNERINSLMQKANNLWLVCKQQNTEGTRIYNKNYSEWLCLDDVRLWDFQEFAHQILGD